jgi:hypothetical protein
MLCGQTMQDANHSVKVAIVARMRALSKRTLLLLPLVQFSNLATGRADCLGNERCQQIPSLVIS